MKKTNVIICILLILSLLILIFSVIDIKKEKSLMEYCDNVKINDDDLIGVALLNEKLEYKEYLQNYKNIKIYQISEYETYLILPKYKKMKINIFELNENNEKGSLINSTSEPFVINCNNVEQSNVILEITYKDITFDYILNLKDNKTNKYITDITKYDVE